VDSHARREAGNAVPDGYGSAWATSFCREYSVEIHKIRGKKNGEIVLPVRSN
jgi:hypothetical protein